MDTKGFPIQSPPPNIQNFQLLVNVGPDPILMICPSCKLDIRTRVSHKATTKTHLMCCLLCCLLCWPCACLPYCMDTCRNTNHYCPSCDAYIGTYQS